jgi:hypothetical protein
MTDSTISRREDARWAALNATRHLADATSIGFDAVRRPASTHRTPRIHESRGSVI